MKDIFDKFFSLKKEAFLQQKVHAKLRGKKNEHNEKAKEEVRIEYLSEANSKYNLDDFLSNIISKVKPNVTTHPAKFTNPKIDTDTAQIFLGSYNYDGYLKTGNINLTHKVDVSGNSATNALIYELYEFLDTNISNKEKVINKFENNDFSLMEIVKNANLDYGLIKEKCFNVYYGYDNNSQTHGSIKQVYFPVINNEYHILSIKTASMVMYEIKKRIDDMNVWIDGKNARTLKKEKTHVEGGFSEVLDITEIGFSHNDFLKMGNYSYLNVKYKGISYLLSSQPPSLKHRSVKLPNRDFFASNLRRKTFADSFEILHRLTQLEINNVSIKEGINNTLKFMIDQILEQAFKVRVTGGVGWSKTEHYANLPKAQAIWLDDAYIEVRETTTEWIVEISRQLVAWLVLAFENSIKQNKLLLGGEELMHIKQFAHEAIAEDQEFFK